MGFIIQNPSEYYNTQKYAAFRYKSEQPLDIEFVTDFRKMPFEMAPNQSIASNGEKPNIWPITPFYRSNDTLIKYLSAIYDQTYYSIVYLIVEKERNNEKINLYIVPVNNVTNVTVYDMSSKFYSMKIIGLFESTKPNTDIRNIFAIFELKSDSTQIVEQFQFPNAFIAQVWDC